MSGRGDSVVTFSLQNEPHEDVWQLVLATISSDLRYQPLCYMLGDNKKWCIVTTQHMFYDGGAPGAELLPFVLIYSWPC